MDVNHFETILNNIKNFKQLTNEQKKIITTFTHEQKDEIILKYNELMSYTNYLINENNFMEDNFYK